MNGINTSEVARNRAARALATAVADNTDERPLTYEIMVGIVAHALTNPSPEASVAAHKLREWNTEDPNEPRFIAATGNCAYADIAQFVIDVADDYRARRSAVTAPAEYSVILAEHLNAVITNVTGVLNAVRSDLLRLAEREGHTVRKLDTNCLENRAKLLRNAVQTLADLRTDVCNGELSRNDNDT